MRNTTGFYQRAMVNTALGVSRGLLTTPSDVQARLKSREPAGPAVKSRAWAGPSAGLIGAGGSAQLAARP